MKIKDITITLDQEDIERISKYTWSINKTSVHREVRINGKRKHISLASEVMSDINNMYDHRNRDWKDNRKENLRLADKQLNSFNRTKRTNCSSQYKGVSWNKNTDKWLVQIFVNKKRITLGMFPKENEKEAALSYNNAASKYYGEYAALNVITE